VRFRSVGLFAGFEIPTSSFPGGVDLAPWNEFVGHSPERREAPFSLPPLQARLRPFYGKDFSSTYIYGPGCLFQFFFFFCRRLFLSEHESFLSRTPFFSDIVLSPFSLFRSDSFPFPPPEVRKYPLNRRLFESFRSPLVDTVDVHC